MTADDGEFVASDDIVITVDPEPQTNQEPTVDAGSDQSVTLNSPAAASLRGTVSDDGLPNSPGAVSTQWSVVSGLSGTVVTFGDPAATDTTATFLDPGTFILRLTATDGELSSSDQVTITVNASNPIQLVVSDLNVASGRAYQVVDGGLTSGALVYIDRSYTYTSVLGTLEGATYIETANKDKSKRGDFFFPSR